MAMTRIRRFALPFITAYSMAVTMILFWFISQHRKMIIENRELRNDSATVLLNKNRDSTMRWTTLRNERHLQHLLGKPSIIKPNGMFWETRCGLYRFYLDPVAGFAHVQGQLPDKRIIAKEYSLPEP